MRTWELKHQTVTRLVICGVFLLVAAIAAPAAWAEDNKDRQIRELRELVNRLGDRVSQLENDLMVKKPLPPAPTAAVAPGVSATPAGVPMTIGDRVRNLEEAAKTTPFLRDGKLHFDETRWVSLGGGLRTSANFIEDAAPNGKAYSKEFKVDDARLYVNGQLFKGIQVELNTEISSDETNVRLLDAVGKFDLTSWLKVWGGRFLTPSDRANLNGPFYQLLWDFPFVSAFPAIFAGRDDGAALWGELFDGHLKYQAGVFRGRVGGPNTSDHKLVAGRLVYNFLDPEPGYYNSSTYFGAKKVLALGVAAQYQADAAGTPTARKDFTGQTVDLLFEYPLDFGVYTFESAFFNYDFGGRPNTLRPAGTLDGKAFYIQTAFLLPQTIGIGQLQPAFRVQYFDSDVTGSSNPSDLNQRRFNFDLNYIIRAHNAKVQLDYTRVQIEPRDRHEVKLGLQLQF